MARQLDLLPRRQVSEDLTLQFAGARFQHGDLGTELGAFAAHPDQSLDLPLQVDDRALEIQHHPARGFGSFRAFRHFSHWSGVDLSRPAGRVKETRTGEGRGFHHGHRRPQGTKYRAP